MTARTYRAYSHDRSFDITLQPDTLEIDGTPVDCSFERVGPDAFSLLLDGRSIPVTVRPADADGHLRVTIGGRATTVRVQDERDLLLEEFGLQEPGADAEREIRAPMPGLVLDIMVDEGDTVDAGDALLVLEAMKMENELRAPTPGVVQSIHVAPGASVNKEALLIEIDVE